MKNPSGTFDLTQLTEMYRGDLSKVRRTVEVFRESIQQEVVVLQAAWIKQDSEGVRNQLHKMRPNAQLLGAKQLLHWIDEVSKANHGNDGFAIELGINRMLKEAKAVYQAMANL